MVATEQQRGSSMSHVAIAALAGIIIVGAAVVLLVLSRHVHQHPGAVLAVVVGSIALIVLSVILARRRRGTSPDPGAPPGSFEHP